MANKKRFHSKEKSERSEGIYEGYNDRRRQEMMDAGMITEDHSAVANLPQYVKYTSWPSHKGYMVDSDLDDTIRGINRQMEEDVSEAKKHLGVHKW